MTTYASPRLTKLSLQILISLIFLFGLFMMIISIINVIDLIGHQQRKHYYHQQQHWPSSSLTTKKILNDDPGGNNVNNNDNDDYDDDDDIDHHHHFPSISSPNVQIMFSLLTFGHSIFGIISITKQRSSLLSTYSYILLIIFLIKLIFIIASLAMYTGNEKMDQYLLSTISILIIITLIIEIILVMIVYQFSRLVKRGDAARQEIQSIHSYHRGRSRSQSQIRSLYSGGGGCFNNNDFGSIDPFGGQNQQQQQQRRQTPTPSSILIMTNSRNVSIEPSSIISTTDNFTYYNQNDESMIVDGDYLPPPIYLKLDK